MDTNELKASIDEKIDTLRTDISELNKSSPSDMIDGVVLDELCETYRRQIRELVTLKSKIDRWSSSRFPKDE